jgi:hypothetical protein
LFGWKDVLGGLFMATLAGFAALRGSAMVAMLGATAAGILGAILVAKPFFRIEELKQMLQLLRDIRPGNAPAVRVRRAAFRKQKLRLDEIELGDRLWMLRGLALIAISYLFALLGFLLSAD